MKYNADGCVSIVELCARGWLSCFQAEAQSRFTRATTVALTQCDPCHNLVRRCKYIITGPAIIWMHLLSELADVAASWHSIVQQCAPSNAQAAPVHPFTTHAICAATAPSCCHCTHGVRSNVK
jgi:hypothetical protein